MIMPNGIKKEECTGCGACVISCPTHCIHMKQDEEGFLFPQYVDKTKCINCGLCRNKCHILIDTYNEEQEKGYGFVSKNIDLLQGSTSGGVFSLLAKLFTDAGHWVFGSIYDNAFNVITTGTTDFSTVRLMCGSKYVLNDTVHSYSDIKEKLDKGLHVLYCGVPCQIAGLKAYLGKEHEKLFLIDILCHGGPSVKLFQTYLRWMEKKHGNKIVSYVFRDKEFGRRTIGTIIFDNGEKLTVMPCDDPYCSAFYSGKTYRKSCYQCRYACRKRVGDLTIGDYWGAETYHPDIDVSNGFSAIIVNNQKGQRLLNLIKNDGLLINTTVDKIAHYNTTLSEPTRPYLYRDKIYEGLSNNRFKYVSNKYMYDEARWKTFLKSYIPDNVKRFMRKVIRRNHN